MKKLLHVVSYVTMILGGMILIGEAVASWWGYQPKYVWPLSLFMGMSAVEFGFSLMLGKIRSR
jgi:hypothetical protein